MKGYFQALGETPNERWGNLVDALDQEQILPTKSIREAFLQWGRHLLVDASDPNTTDEALGLAGENAPFPIGHDQTVSQPEMVACMTELLQPKNGETVLDVGLGSGWQALLLRALVGNEGMVYGMERIEALTIETRARFARLKIDDIFIIHGDALNRSHIPNTQFDIITCAAATDKIPDFWIDFLKEGGRMCYPKQVGMVQGKMYYSNGELQYSLPSASDGPMYQLCLLTKNNGIVQESFHGPLCRYVPLLKGVQ